MAKEVGKSDPGAEQTQQQAAQAQAPTTRHKADRIVNEEGACFRAPAGVHVRELGDIINGTFHGVLDTKEGKKRWRVLHGCPVNGLPEEVVDKIKQADPTAIAPWTPPAADQVR